MPTPITHGVVAFALGRTYAGRRMPVRFWVCSVVCSTLPDADVIGFHLGVDYAHLFGHRGFFHSPFFALVLAALIVVTAFRDTRAFSRTWWALLAYFAALGASHGVLDALTDGGLGVAFLSPFSNARYFFPWRPIAVAPISVRAFFGEWGLRVIPSEILWVWAPCGALCLAGLLVMRLRRADAGKRA